MRRFALGIVVLVLVVVVALLLGSRGTPPPAPPRFTERGDSASADALLAKYYPAKSSPAAPSRYVRIAPVADGFAPPDMQPALNTPGSRWRNPAKTVQPIFPTNFSNPVRVHSGVADVSAVPEGANPDSVAQLNADGSLVYADAFGPGIDVVYRCEALKTEEFIVIRQTRNPSFSWHLQTRGLKPRLTPAHTLELCDEKGVPRLRINAPEGKDANGKLLRASKELRITLDENRVTLTADTSGLEFPIVIDPTWSSTGAFAFNRENHINVRLDDGTVLATGGNARVDGLPLAQAERFDPISEVWSSAGSMSVARNYHTATLLGNGKVLVAAGFSVAGAAESSCEIYDPGNNSWSTVNPLNTARSDTSATLLADGTVLIAGGTTGTSFIATAEIYDVGLNSWIYTNSPLNNARSGHRAARLGDDTVLIASGDPTYTQCELYDPSNKTFSATGSLTNSISRITTLNDGTVLSITGGQGPQFATELFDPVAHTWSTPASRHSNGTSAGLVTLSNGKALVIGGYENNDVATCEIYNPTQEVWSLTSQLPQAQSNCTATVLSDDRVLITGGQPVFANFIFSPKPVASNISVSGHWGTPIPITLTSDSVDAPASFSIVSQPQHGTLSGTSPNIAYTAANGFVGTDSFTYTATDSFGTGPQATISINVTNNAPVASDQSFSTHWGTPKAITLGASDADSDALQITIVQLPQHGDFDGSTPNLTYHPRGTYVGPDSFTFVANDGAADSNIATVSITVTNIGPAVIIAATPTSITPNAPVAFTATGTDPDNDPLTYAWNFGDGATSTDQNPSHSYADVGVYTATVTVSDPAGATASASVTINVSKAPIVRVQTSDVAGFATQPFTFDASTSTDPENAIASYDWDFGDGTPHGSGQVISKVYDQPGTYNVTLTITDSAGVSSTLTRVIEVLAASEAGLFNGFMNYKVSWNRQSQSKDSLSLDASVNVGDEVIGAGTHVALEIVGQRFEGTLDLKQRDYSNPNRKWQLKSGIRHQPSGTVSVKLKIKNASLGLGFNLVGVTAGGDPHDIVSKDVTVHLEIGTRSFELPVPSDFKFNADGTKAKGAGESD